MFEHKNWPDGRRMNALEPVYNCQINMPILFLNAKNCLLISFQVCTVLQLHSESGYQALRQSGVLVSSGFAQSYGNG